jgi:exodeoxyribonuclease-5
MTSFTPSNSQAAAIRAIKIWFETRTAEQQIFRLFGFAGSGKLNQTGFIGDDLVPILRQE